MSIYLVIPACVVVAQMSGQIILTCVPSYPVWLRPIVAGVTAATIVYIALVSINH